MKRFLKAALYTIAAFIVGTVGTFSAFFVAVRWLVHTEPGIGKVYGAGLPSLCVGLLAAIGTFIILLGRSPSTMREP